MSGKCAVCGAEFRCGREATDTPCWCSTFPPIFPLEKEALCLCPACLKNKTIEKIKDWVERASQEKELRDKIQELSTIPLLEGIDFYQEEGNIVFTSWYHLKRGTCCKCGCRHCPYRSN